MSQKRMPLLASLIVGLAAVACSGSQASPSASPSAAAASGAAGTVEVTLQEWAVLPASPSGVAGEVTFHVTNTGPADTHEFVVIKTDLDPGSLPTADTGAVSETGTGMEVKGEIEDVAVGSSQDLKLTLDAGKYVLLCNIYDETEKEAHYKMGMRTPFTVN